MNNCIKLIFGAALGVLPCAVQAEDKSPSQERLLKSCGAAAEIFLKNAQEPKLKQSMIQNCIRDGYPAMPRETPAMQKAMICAMFTYSMLPPFKEREPFTENNTYLTRKGKEYEDARRAQGLCVQHAYEIPTI